MEVREHLARACKDASRAEDQGTARTPGSRTCRHVSGGTGAACDEEDALPPARRSRLQAQVCIANNGGLQPPDCDLERHRLLFQAISGHPTTETIGRVHDEGPTFARRTPLLIISGVSGPCPKIYMLCHIYGTQARAEGRDERSSCPSRKRRPVIMCSTDSLSGSMARNDAGAQAVPRALAVGGASYLNLPLG